MFCGFFSFVYKYYKSLHSLLSLALFLDSRFGFTIVYQRTSHKKYLKQYFLDFSLSLSLALTSQAHASYSPCFEFSTDGCGRFVLFWIVNRLFIRVITTKIEQTVYSTGFLTEYIYKALARVDLK